MTLKQLSAAAVGLARPRLECAAIEDGARIARFRQAAIDDAVAAAAWVCPESHPAAPVGQVGLDLPAEPGAVTPHQAAQQHLSESGVPASRPAGGDFRALRRALVGDTPRRRAEIAQPIWQHEVADRKPGSLWITEDHDVPARRNRGGEWRSPVQTECPASVSARWNRSGTTSGRGGQNQHKGKQDAHGLGRCHGGARPVNRIPRVSSVEDGRAA